ncbi:MAG: hypothetical protein IPO30_21425 [Hyphomonadaceae bacterium]|nr:hypothetical protein [Hyphomonadaceae bacterium]
MRGCVLAGGCEAGVDGQSARASAEIDHLVELGVAVGHGGGDDSAVIGIVGNGFDGFLVTQEREV